MPWHISSDHPDCSGFAVVKDDDNSVAGCHKTKEDAQKQLAALYANEGKHFPAYIKALTPDNATVAGYGVIYGGLDLEGETFSDQTDFMLDLAPVKLVLYDHSLGELKHVIGKTSVVEADENGLWVEAELNRHKAYVDLVLQLVEKGVLGWSSGSVGHLTRRSGKSITQWPIVELSLTPTPAEPRTLGVELLKSLVTLNPDFSRLLPEADRKSAVQSEEEGESAENSQDNFQEEAMPEELATPVAASTTNTVILSPPAADAGGQVKAQIDAALAPYLKVLEALPVNGADLQLPMVNSKTKLGDSETKAWAHWIRTGDEGSIQQYKASSNNPMNETTPAQGGYAVPVGMYNQIIAKLRESALYGPLGVRQIPGKGLTVNVPVEGAKDGAFVATGEGATTDRDAPILGQAPMTLVKYTKRIELSWELMEDEDANLMNFLANFVGLGMAKTHNTLLVTEAVTNGTLGVAWGNPIVAGNIPALVYALPQGYEDNAAWILNKSVEGIIRGFTGNYFQFIPTPADGPGALSRRELFGYPLYNSAAMATSAASAKAAVFGNFSYMGMRLAPDITFLRDPYSAAITGQLRLHYYFRTVYKVLQAEAVLYAQMGT
jgi:HK97 family phage major capsid protein